MTLQAEGFYAGLSALQFDPTDEWNEYELGKGLVIRPTYAHLMNSHTMAFAKPEKPGQHHPAPWKATTQYESYDVNVELFIPDSYKSKLTPYETARVIICMMRLFVDPKIRFLVHADRSFSEIAPLDDRAIHIATVEVSRQYINLEIVEPELAASRLYWIRDNWEKAVRLMSSHADFKLAMEAFELSTFIPHHALTLVSLWGALEVLFSPSTTELRFRVSVLIASYIHPPGMERAKAQKEIFDLYDKRSAAAHGKPKHDTEHLLQTFNILRSVLIRMIEDEEVPSKNALNDMLMGVD